ncbi:sodium:solute symporter family protein [Acidobacteria bacterium AH-259-G07]|nr:sodium:solute symporter family protein [Acidobacteria bacterium AH-259-G07]
MITTGVIFVYLVLVLLIGAFSHKLFRGTGEDYFVATRTIGPFILLMSLFGTNMTSFALLGASGEAYHQGIGVFSLMASAGALVIPCVFFFVGPRVWSLGKRHGYLTQVQLFRERWGSDGFGLVLFVVLIALIIPYLLIGIMAGGITLNEITNGQIPEWAGGLTVCLVVLAYVTYGGLRGTAWANTFQTLVFMILGGVTFYVVVDRLGGFSAALARVVNQHPELLIRGDSIQPLKLLTYTFVLLSVGMFPHMFMHWLSARRAATFRYPLMFYPVCIAVVWLPSVLLGILGSVDFPGLKGPQANYILVKMIGLHAPEILAGLLAAGVLAAVMSSLDSQVLSIGSMFTQDIVRHYGFHDRMSEKQQVLVGRLFVVGILVVTYLLFLISNRSIFRLGIWSFSGFSALFPIVVAALFWKRSTKYGAFASVFSVVVLWIYFFLQAGRAEDYTIGGTGVMPVAVILAVSTAAMILFSLLSKAPDQAVIEKFFPSGGGRP